MTNPDLERELVELLPCISVEAILGGAPTCNSRGVAPCLNCCARPAILAWVQRKLVEGEP